MPATDQFWRNLKSMHVVFALSSLALFGSTIWMMWADHSREWRTTRKVGFKLEAAKLKADAAAISGSADYSAKIESLEQQRDAAQDELAGRKTEQQELETTIAALEREVDLATRLVRVQRAVRDKARADFDLGVRDGLESQLEGLLSNFQAENARVQELELDLEGKQLAVDETRGQLDEIVATRDELQSALSQLQSQVDRLEEAAELIAPETITLNVIKRALMEWPVIDGFNSHIKIIQDWLPENHITLGMASTARFDRCRTCHMNIDLIESGNRPSFPFGHPQSDEPAGWVAENKFPHPFATHPNPDLYLTESSPHPLGTFGCTTCHDGNGSGTVFQNSEHTPNDPHHAHEWEKEFGWHSNHFWEYPMWPQRFEESGCIKCHHSVVELGIHPKFGASAPKVFAGWELVTKLGCFGCHEIRGFDAAESIGPDLRLEPNYTEAAAQLLHDPAVRKATAADPALAEIQRLANSVLDDPGRDTERRRLRELVLEDARQKAKESRGQPASASDGDAPRMRHLSSRSHELASVLEDVDIPGDLRKVGPSLRHLASKTTAEWAAYWTEEPKRFRPTTRMPQFFKLTNQQDPHAQEFMPVEIAGIVQYLMDKSQPLDLLAPEPGYEPNPERGKTLLSQRGCLACHTHDAFPDPQQKLSADFGPNLSKVHAKIKSGAKGFQWLYTWLRDPERHHPRARMPNPFLSQDTFKGTDGAPDYIVDPAADIAAFLLQKGPMRYAVSGVSEEVIDELTHLYVSKVLSTPKVKETLETRRYPLPPEQIKGDEIELAGASSDAEATSEQWRTMKLNYIGRRTISRYGCYGCHDIPGFETARPIGTALQDWGRKDTSKLASEHIAEYLQHHGEPEGEDFPGTLERVQDAARRANGDDFTSPEKQQEELSAAFYVESLLHHGRPGFLWQKLRQPRSYDYEKIDTKGYDERLRMPKFPVTELQIDKIATFILGLVAEPPAEQYVYRPTGADYARVEGERLLRKYNCTGCHMLEMPKITFGIDRESPSFWEGLDATDYQHAFDLNLRLYPPREAATGEKLETGEPIVALHALPVLPADLEEAPEDQFSYFDVWENATVEGRLLQPSARIEVPQTKLIDVQPARGGRFAEWLVESLMEGANSIERRYVAWQQSPPPLYREGVKVQTSWLYRFLKNPVQLRHTTVLRMPRFNMSDDEARTLANYFAAVDGTEFPYQEIPQRDPAYLSRQSDSLGMGESSYLSESWQVLNLPLCIKCHSVGGRQVQVSDPKVDIRGPNLDLATDRLRPDWILAWLYNPRWITPYTSMPATVRKGTPADPHLLSGDSGAQNVGLRDALMNYHRLMESLGKVEAAPQTSATGQ